MNCESLGQDHRQFTLDDKVAAMRDPRSYAADETATVTAIETHFAWVFLTDRYAYKLKKPINYQMIDLRALPARRANCEREIVLNRRLAPQVYLGTIPLTHPHEQALRVGPGGEIVDWLVWMKRIPAHCMLDVAMKRGNVPAKSLDDVGAMLAHFYASQPAVITEPRSYLGSLEQFQQCEFDELRSVDLRLDRKRVRDAAFATSRAFERARMELGERARAGRVVDGHGDLRPEHISLAQPVAVIDALEISDALRVLDAARELAFLWTECSVAGRDLIGESIFRHYERHRSDRVSDELMGFYRSCSALTRAKLTAWHLRDPLYRDLAPWGELAERYLQFAEHSAHAN